MFMVDSEGGALGSPRIRVAHFRSDEGAAVRVVRGGRVRYAATKQDRTTWEAFHVALGATMVGATDVLVVPPQD